MKTTLKDEDVLRLGVSTKLLGMKEETVETRLGSTLNRGKESKGTVERHTSS